MSNGCRQHAIIAYNEKSIEAIKDFATHITYIVHDKDTKVDGTPKALHYHILAYTDNAKTSSAFFKAYKKAMCKLMNDKEFFENANHNSNIECQYVKDVNGVIDYLTHENDDNKFHYSIEDIQGDIEWWRNNVEELKQEIEVDKSDWTLELMELFISNNHRVPRSDLVRLARLYGRDFILNFGKALDSFSKMLGTVHIDYDPVTPCDENGRACLVDTQGEVVAKEVGGSNPFLDKKNYKEIQ